MIRINMANPLSEPPLPEPPPFNPVNWGKNKMRLTMKGWKSYASLTPLERLPKAWGSVGKGSFPFALGFGVQSALAAPRHHKVSAGLATGMSIGVTTALSVGVSALTGLPPMLTDLALQAMVQPTMDKFFQGAIQPLVDFGTNQRRVNFGGDYRDTATAMTMRQVAAREMSASLMNARQWLGQEGAFMHQ